MKNSITKLALILFSAGSLSAQDKKMSTSISVNMNSGSSSSDGVSKNFGLNPNIGANFFWGKLGAGLDVGTFNSSPDFDFAGYAQQSLGTVKRVRIPTDRETSRSTYFLVGPQYAIRKGKMNIILSTKAGITINKMAEFQIEDEASSNVLASYKAPEDFVRNAFTLKPSLSIGYDLTKSFSLTANAQFVKQTGQQDFTTSYRDLSYVQTIDLKGNPLRQPEITKNIGNAPVISTSTKGASEFMSFGMGLTYTIKSASKAKQSEAKGNLKAMNGGGEVAKTAGWKIPENEKVIVNPDSGSGNENTSESIKAKQSEAKGNLKAMNGSGEASKTAGWKIPENEKVIVNPGSGYGNESTSESIKAKQSEAKGNLKSTKKPKYTLRSKQSEAKSNLK